MNMSNKRDWREITVNDNTDVWDKENPIEGVLVKIELDVGPKKSKMYTLKTTNGEIKVWGSTVLDNKLEDIVEGNYIKIEYEGKQKSSIGNEYHNFRVFIDDGSVRIENRENDTDEPINIDDIPF